MNKIFKYLLPVILIVIVVFSLFLKSKKEESVKQNNQSSKIRIGWQIPWATEGQLTQVLKNTDILKNNNLDGDFKGFSSGAPLNEAALAGEVDILFTADQPAATLLNKSSDWIIIGRLMYNRVSLYVPPNSPIKSVSDLKNKTVGMPFGAAAQRMALKAEKDAGLNPKTDVKNVNLDIYEQSDLVRDPKSSKWGNMDALAGFDPTPAIFEEKGLIKTLTEGKVVSVIMMSKKYIQENQNAPVNFLRAFHQAYDYYRNNISAANDWFVTESKLSITPKALEIAASIEPNLSAKSSDEIRLGFIDEDYKIMQEAADFIFDQELVKSKINMRENIDLSYLQKANLK